MGIYSPRPTDSFAHIHHPNTKGGIASKGAHHQPRQGRCCSTSPSNSTPCSTTTAPLFHTLAVTTVLYEALFAALAHAFDQKDHHVPRCLEKDGFVYDACVDLQEYSGGVVYPVTNETITNYKKLANAPLSKDTWTRALCKELGKIAQGYGDKKGTNTVRFLTHAKIAAIPKDRRITYARIVVDYRPQKDDPNCIRITVGGNLIEYPGDLTTRTTDLTTTKLLRNSVVSTRGANTNQQTLKVFTLRPRLIGLNT